MQSYDYKVIALRKRDGFATLFLVACLKDAGDFVLRISCISHSTDCLCSVPSVTIHLGNHYKKPCSEGGTRFAFFNSES